MKTKSIEHVEENSCGETCTTTRATELNVELDRQAQDYWSVLSVLVRKIPPDERYPNGCTEHDFVCSKDENRLELLESKLNEGWRPVGLVGIPEKGQRSYRVFEDVRGAAEEMSSLEQYAEEEDLHFLQVLAEGTLFANRVSYIAKMLRKIPYAMVMEAINRKHLGGALRRLPEIVFMRGREMWGASGKAVGETQIALDEYKIAHAMIKTKGRENLTAVLVHEMIHCLQLQTEGKTDHGKDFERWCMYAAHSGLRVDGPDCETIPPAAKKPNAHPLLPHPKDQPQYRLFQD
jgi:hypothetical protein